MFFALSPYFKLEPSPSMYFVTFLVCGASHHHRKKTHIFLLFFLPSSPMRLYGICCRSGLWVFSCSVASHGIVGCSSQYWLLLFFLRFQLMLGTASPWLGQSLFVFDFVFLVVGLPSIVSARFGFQDLVFGVLTSMLSFIARGRLHSLLISFRLSFPLYSRISLQLSSHLWWLSLSPCLPLEIWIMFSFVYAMWAWKVIYGLKFSLWFLSGCLLFSLSQVVSFLSIFLLV